jgi:hypothetical protein
VQLLFTHLYGVQRIHFIPKYQISGEEHRTYLAHRLCKPAKMSCIADRQGQPGKLQSGSIGSAAETQDLPPTGSDRDLLCSPKRPKPSSLTFQRPLTHPPALRDFQTAGSLAPTVSKLHQSAKTIPLPFFFRMARLPSDLALGCRWDNSATRVLEGACGQSVPSD